MNGLAAGSTAFREAYFAADPAVAQAAAVDGFGEWDARRARYAIYWSMYQNDTYRKIRTFAKQYKGEYALYRHTRGVYNPSRRLANFWRTHLMGGGLDHLAGDGKETPTALPIDGADAATRAAIARLWWDSNWETRKAVYTLWGTVLGDVGLTLIDDAAAGMVALDVVHPGTVKWVERDARGEVTAYVRVEQRFDPRANTPTSGPAAILSGREVTYTEIAELDGGGVQYRTFLDGKPFDWRPGPDGRPLGDRPGARPEWTAPYGFVPLWLVAHEDAGLGWGLSEFEGGRAKFDEVNDLGSKLHDQIRKMVEGAWLFSGIPDPAATPKAANTAPTRPQAAPTREELKAFYGPVDAKATSLVSPLNIADTSAEIRATLDGIEDDYPELRFERLRTGGQVSGEALRVARQPASARVEERRPTYDSALVKAQMAALAIGGLRGYRGYESFGLEAYDAATPTHRIGARSVFAVEPLDTIAEKQARFAAIGQGTAAGLPLAVVMADLGYSPADVAEAVRAKDEADAKALAQQQAAKTPNQQAGEAKPTDGPGAKP